MSGGKAGPKAPGASLLLLSGLPTISVPVDAVFAPPLIEFAFSSPARELAPWFPAADVPGIPPDDAGDFVAGDMAKVPRRVPGGSTI